MLNIEELRNYPPEKISELFVERGTGNVNLENMGKALNVSVLPYDFSALADCAKDLVCIFVTNDSGKACIFCDEKLGYCNEETLRKFILTVWARRIVTQEKNFYISENTVLSHEEEKMLYELLMPEEQVKDVVLKSAIPMVSTLCDVFHVSREDAVKRLDQLKLTVLIAGYNY